MRFSIDKDSLADRVYAQVLHEIVSGALPPNSKVDLNALARDFDVSRTPLREAFLTLKQINLAQVTPYTSTVIADWGPVDMAERSVTLGHIAAFTLLPQAGAEGSNRLRAARDEQGVATRDDIDHFGSMCDALIRASLPKTHAAIFRVHAEPLFAYLRSRGPVRHGIDLASTRRKRQMLISRARSYVSAGDCAETARAIVAYACCLAKTLSPRG